MNNAITDLRSSISFNRRGSRIACQIVLASFLGSNALIAAAQGAGALTPGGIQPQLDERTLPSQEAAPKYEVPPVPERPLGGDEGPRIPVSEFVLNGTDELSRAGIDELFQGAINNHPDGFSIGELQDVANAVTLFYRAQGFILAQAYLPEQNVTEQRVTIELLSGTLGQLKVDGNERYSEPLITKLFSEQLGQTVNAKSTESKLLSINDLPGLKLVGIFRPGEQIGETELVLKPTEQDPFELYLSADNHGVETTGTERAFAHFTWNSPLGLGDRLRITGLQTINPSDSTYGALNYEIPVVSPRSILGLSLSTNDYLIAQSISRRLPETDGDTDTSTLYYRQQWVRSRDFNFSTVADFSMKAAEIEFEDFAIEREDKLSVFGLALEFDQVDTQYRGLNEGSIRFSQGLADFAGAMDKEGDGRSLNGAGGDFQKINLELTRLQALSQNHSLLLRLEAQHSDDVLSSLEQFSMGGPRSVRAYPVSEYVRDKAIFGSAAWVINAPGFADKPAFAGRSWGEVFRVSFFADYAHGKLNQTVLGIDESVEISGAGLGLELRLTDNFFIRAEGAKALSSRDDSRGEDSQYWLSFGLQI